MTAHRLARSAPRIWIPESRISQQHSIVLIKSDSQLSRFDLAGKRPRLRTQISAFERAEWRSLRLCAAERIEYAFAFQARMNIETFVSEALEQLGAGVAKVKGNPAISLSPVPYTDEKTNQAGDRLIDSRGNEAIIVFVQFDLSVVVSGHVEGGAKAGLQVLGFDIGIGGKVEGGIDHTRVQRIKFEVPVSFPRT